jgi:lysophospholipase L1-like esterase
MIEISPDKLGEFLLGWADLVEDRDWTAPYRLPVTAKRPFIHPDLLLRAWMPAGVRLDVVTDAAALHWPVEVLAPTDYKTPRLAGPIDVEVDGVARDRVTVDGLGELRVDGLPEGEHRIRVWLPQIGTVRLGPLRADGATTLRPAPQGPAWVVYGSSITQCAGAYGPSETWPAIVATRLGWDVFALGFGGQAHLDPAVAQLIRDRPADLISICAGANVHGKETFSPRSFGPALAGFVDTVRDGHPDTPMTLMSAIVAPDREEQANVLGFTMAGTRTEVRRIATALRDRGDAVEYIDGLDILGAADAHLLSPDGLHPTADGYRLMGERMTERLSRYAL